MKRIATILLILAILLPSYALAAPPTPVQEPTTASTLIGDTDLNDMTREELHSLINRARAALQKYEVYAETDNILLDQFGVKVIMKGYELDGTTFNMSYIIENNSDQDLIITADNEYMNGRDVHFLFSNKLESGKKTKDKLRIYDINEIGISSTDDLETLELIFELSDAESYKTITTSDKITIVF